MSTFKTTHGVGEPRDLFYPNVLTPTKVPTLNPKSVQDSFRRIFDMVYSIQPPPGSRSASTIFDTPHFTENFNVKLENKVVVLKNHVFLGTTGGGSWNSHTLTYNGIAYTIAEGTPSTNKWIYWSIDKPTEYQRATSFPTLGQDDYLIAVYNSSDNTVYEFWNAKMAPAFISTALIEDLAVTDAKIDTLTATKITTGTLAAGVAITLTKHDTTPAKFIFEDTAAMYADTSQNAVILDGETDGADGFVSGNTSAFSSIEWHAFSTGAGGAGVGLDAFDSSNNKGARIRIDSSSSTAPIAFQFGTVRGAYSGNFNFTSTNATCVTGSWRVNTDGQGVGTATNGFSFYESGDKTEGYANNVLSFKFDSTSAAGTTNLYVYHNGSLKLVTVDASDLGSGAKNYLYVP